MAHPFVYATNADGGLLWFRHLGQEDGSFRWLGANQVGFGWTGFPHIFSGGGGVIYLVQPVTEARIDVHGHVTPASDGNLDWYRHVGQEDGSFRWEGPKRVGTGWAAFEHLFSGGNGIIYAIERFVEARVNVHGGVTPASGGRLLWYRHLGQKDGSTVWEGPKVVGTGWSGFPHAFSGGDGVIYLVEPVVDARIDIHGHVTPASGGKLRWYRHLGHQDGSVRWEGPKVVGSGWSGFPHAFSSGNGIIYLVEPVVEATIDIQGHVTKASGGNLRWYRHLGYQDGTFRWEGPQIVGTGWGSLERVFPSDVTPTGVPVPVAGKRFCGFPDPSGGVGLRPTAYTLKENRRKLTLTWTVLAQLPGFNLANVMSTAFGVWKKAISSLNFVFIPSSVTNPGAPLNPAADIQVGTTSFPAGSSTIGSTRPDGSLIQFNVATPWVASNPTPPGSSSLLAVAIHEIGHAIGLLHSTADATVMNAFNGNLEALTADDINGAKALYGWQAQRQLPNRGTDSGPALCACGPVLAMAWKGVHGDQNIYYASSRDGVTWSSQRRVVGVGTSDSPSLAWDGVRLWMAWTGIQGDSSLYLATTLDPTSWPDNPGVHIDGVGSSNGPSIAMAPGPTLVWKGISGDSGLFLSNYNPANNPPWGPQHHVDNVGSSDRPALVSDVNGQPLMVWKGIEGDSNLWFSTQAGNWQPQQPVSWVIPGNGGSPIVATRLPGTSCGPGSATDGSRVFVAWRGAGDDSGIWFTQRARDVVNGINKVEWSSQGNIPGVGTSHRPAAAFFGGRLHLAWKGVDGDQTIWMTTL